jgi:hypothetical protein
MSNETKESAKVSGRAACYAATKDDAASFLKDPAKNVAQGVKALTAMLAFLAPTVRETGSSKAWGTHGVTDLLLWIGFDGLCGKDGSEWQKAEAACAGLVADKILPKMPAVATIKGYVKGGTKFAGGGEWKETSNVPPGEVGKVHGKGAIALTDAQKAIIRKHAGNAANAVAMKANAAIATMDPAVMAAIEAMVAAKAAAAQAEIEAANIAKAEAAAKEREAAKKAAGRK